MKDIAVGVDIGGTFTKIGLVDTNGHILADTVIKTTDEKDIDSFMAYLHKTIKGLMESLPVKMEIIGMGVGAPNGNFYSGTIEYAPNLSWKGVISFVEISKKHLDVPTFLTNDANAAAVGEKIYGGAKNMNDFIVITLGTGLGSGLFVNGKLVYGHDGFAGELGHVTVDLNGRICGCGRKGCLETYASATGIRRTAFELMAVLPDPSELRQYSFEDLDSEKIYYAALNGDKLAREAFEYTGRILGIKLADSVVHTSPEAIFLFGGLAKAGDLVIEPTKRHMENHLLKVFKNKVKVIPSGLTEKNAAILGASALVWQELDNSFT
jgi:glucokinase